MRVRQIGISSSTITVETVEPYPETIVLRIVCESSGFYAVEYESSGKTVCGEFVGQELYLQSEDSKFYGDNANLLVVRNGDGTKWAELND